MCGFCWGLVIALHMAILWLHILASFSITKEAHILKLMQQSEIFVILKIWL